MADTSPLFSYCLADSKLAEIGKIPGSNLISQDGNPSHLAANKNLWWPNGKKLRVRFLNGTPKLHDKVKQYAKAWEDYANIDFRFIEEGDADIRVGFAWKHDAGTWSYVGRDAEKFALGQNSVTMNFGELDDNTREEVYCRVITHEFGHAIGCVHEHQANPIEWNVPRVIADCKRQYNWSETTTREQIINLERDLTILRKSDFDSNSIMCYYFPPEWTADGTSAPTNLRLSTTDKSFIAKIYPFQTRDEGELTIDPEIRPWYPPVALNSKAIEFSTPYLATPRIVVGLKSLDIGNTADIRVRAGAARVTEDQFVLNIDSWDGGQLFNAASTWIEFSDGDSHFVVGECNTLDNRPLQMPAPADEQGVRRDTEHFDFPDGRFTDAPNVLVWLSALNMDRAHNWRVRAKASNITSSGFDLDIESWGDTNLYNAAASWAAYPRNSEGVVGGKVSTRELRDWYPPSPSNSKKVKFPPKFFDKKPKVYIGINELDMDSSGNLRVKVYADKVDASGFVWHGDSWGDSQLYTLGADWIAFG